MRRDRTAEAVRLGNKRARGFTLLEVLVGATLLMIAMAGLVPFFLSGLSQSSTVRYRSTANNIAREKMEEIRQLDYREITGVPFLEDRFGSTKVVRDVTYDIDYGVVESPYGSGVLKEVTVTVGWTAPPKVSPVSLTTMIHQQFVGPRIARIEVPDAVPDTLGGSPFYVLPNLPTTHILKAHVAEADWGLVINNLNQSGMTARDVYLKLARVDDLGNATAFLDTDGDDEIRGLTWTLDGDDKVNDVYIPYTVKMSDLPDGYWEFRAVLFNQYDEPGNVWPLRLRVESSAPPAPTGFVAIPQYGDESVMLYWSGGAELDRANYVLQRRTKEGADWKSWVTLSATLDPNAVSYLDQGSIATQTDPWGTTADPQNYEYRIWAVDTAGHVGATASATAYIPPSVPVTTTTVVGGTTTSIFTTTTVVGTQYYSLILTSGVNKKWTVTITSDNPSQGTVVVDVDGKVSVTVPDLLAGKYHVVATAPGKTDVVADPTLGPGWDPTLHPILLN